MGFLRFREMSVTRVRHGECPVCHKASTRTVRATQTANPFNTNPDGSLRSVPEVWAAIEAEADAIVPDFTHKKCREVTP